MAGIASRDWLPVAMSAGVGTASSLSTLVSNSETFAFKFAAGAQYRVAAGQAVWLKYGWKSDSPGLCAAPLRADGATDVLGAVQVHRGASRWCVCVVRAMCSCVGAATHASSNVCAYC